MSNVEVIHELVSRWNAGDFDSVLDLYTEDAEMHTGPEWPEPASYYGRDEIRAGTEEWRSVWETVTIEMAELHEHGDKVAAIGAWKIRGGASGVGGEMPIVILFTLRDGKIAVLEWLLHRDEAIAAARGA
jgi:ketosteroid isomerase-like protein